MADTQAGRNMLLGILAVQMDFINRDQLIVSMNAWVLDKTKALDEVLLERGALRQDARDLLVALVDKHLEVHAGDAEKSLASLSSIGSVRDDLQSLADPEITASLGVLGKNRPVEAFAAGASVSAGTSTSAGTRFRILRPHAKGGLGEVAVAHDSELNREVALKEIQARHAGDQERRSRFVMEAEITGGLEHPGIVPVYGLGTYSDGRPFYAMRFIRGDSLREAIGNYHAALAKGKLPSRESLQLRKLLGRLVDVCQAIEYAHSRGVLHRDLKPGNIMLGKYGETLVVDWGLAKLKGRGEHTKTEEEATLEVRSGSSIAPTRLGSAIGTPAYMPPEQAAGKLDELGPASDVYSLGATLYCLLTGRPPIEGQDVGEVLKKVRAGDFAPPRSIRPDIPRPLQSICLRAMATKPAERYASPRALADDIERFLADEPVAAHTEPLSVRARRWMRKHPRSVTALAATLLVGLTSTLVIATVVSGKNRQLAKANTDLDRANAGLSRKNVQLEAANQAEREAKKAAESRRRESEAVLEFFQNKVLAVARPKGQQGGLGIDVTIRAAVDAAEPQVANSFTDKPLVEASIRDTLGRTYRYLGEAQLAIRQHERARRLLHSNLGPDHLGTLESMNNLAGAYEDAGRLDKALPIFEKALKLRKAILGPDHSDTLRSMNNLALAYNKAGRLDEALALYEETLKLTKERFAADDPEMLASMNNLALAYQDAGRLDEALPIFEDTLKLMKEQLGPDHPDILTLTDNLAGAYFAAGKFGDALLIYDKTLNLKKKILGPDHPSTLTSMGNLASTYYAAGRLDDALPIFEETLKLRKEKLGSDHPGTLMSMSNLALAYQDGGRLDEAIALHEETLNVRKEILGPDHLDTFTSMNNLALAYSKVDRWDEAITLQKETVKLLKQKLGPNHPNTLMSMNNLASAYKDAGRLEEALALHEETLELITQKLGPDHPSTLVSVYNLARAYQDAGRLDEAFPILEETLKLLKQKLGPNHPRTLEAMDSLARAHRDAGRLDEAIAFLNETLRRKKEKLGPDHEGTLTTMYNLAGTYVAAGQLDEALPMLEETLELITKTLGPDHPQAIRSLNNLAQAYLQATQTERALPLFEQFIAAHRKSAKADDPRFAGTLATVAIALLEHQQHSAAETYLRESLSILEKTMANDCRLFVTQSMLGESLTGQGIALLPSDRETAIKKFTKAESLLIAGYEGMKQREHTIPADGQVRLTEALKRLVDLYTALEKPDEAAKWQAELDKRLGKNATQ